MQNGPAGHFTTGIFGTKYILETLSEYSSPQEVYNIVNSTEYPGWDHMIDQGATTIWETWKESDNTYSNCHSMFGSVTEWFYRYIGGIRPISDKPGFKEFILSPSIPDDLDYVNCSYHTPYGEIVSNCKKVGQNGIQYEIKIPEGSSASIDLIHTQIQNIELQNRNKSIVIDSPEGLTKGKFILNKGEYVISLTL